MAKFGHFQAGAATPLAQFEGDSMEMEKQFVRIYKSGSTDLGTYDPTHPTGTLVAAICLDKGQYVKKTSD
jgi:hypothetical protein